MDYPVSLASPRILIETGDEPSARFAFQFALGGIPRRVLRLTGGCAFMSPEDSLGLQRLEDALADCYEGVILFGGTRMYSLDKPGEVIPGITEVAPAVRARKEKVRIYGVAPRLETLELSPSGHLVIPEPTDYASRLKGQRESDQGPKRVTVIHPYQDMALILQQNVDKGSPYEAEYKRCLQIVDELHGRNWLSLLLVYNGGKVTEQELLAWAKLGLQDPSWQVLLVNGSGRIADEYAQDKKFLTEHPTVHVSALTVEAIRENVEELVIKKTS